MYVRAVRLYCDVRCVGICVLFFCFVLTVIVKHVGEEGGVLAQPAAADGGLLGGQRDLLQDPRTQPRRLRGGRRALRPLHHLLVCCGWCAGR